MLFFVFIEMFHKITKKKFEKPLIPFINMI